METTDLQKLSEDVRRPTDAMRTAAAERWSGELALPPRSFGSLEKVAGWLCAVQGQCPPRPIERARLVLFAGDHGIAAVEANGHRVTAQPPGSTAATLRMYGRGEGPANVLARAYDATVSLLDVSVDCDPAELAELPAEVTAGRIRRGTGRIDQEAACSRAEAEAAFALGRELADAEVDAGADLLVPGLIGAGHTTPAAVLVAALTGADAASVTGRGSGVD